MGVYSDNELKKINIMEKTVTYDDTRDIAIRVIYELIELGHLKDDEDHYFEIQDTIQDEINEVLGLEMDETEEITIKKNK